MFISINKISKNKEIEKTLDHLSWKCYDLPSEIRIQI